MVSNEEEHWAVAKMAGTGKHILVRNIEDHEVMEYFMEGGSEMMCVKDEEVRMGGDIDSEPQEGREHRWISVVAPITKFERERKWGETERRALAELLEIYKISSLASGSRKKREIWVTNKGWEGSMIDMSEHHPEQPIIRLMRWKAVIEKEAGERLKQLNEGIRGRKEILGKMGEEGNRDMEELIYTRGPRCVREPSCRVRWASPIIQGAGETDKPASIAKYITASFEKMDSSGGQRMEGEELHSVGELEQSSEEFQEGSLTLEDLLRLQNIIVEELRGLEEI